MKTFHLSGSTLRNILYTISLILFLQICLYNGYLLFHVFVEFIAIVIIFSLFVVTWNSRKIIKNQYLLLIGLSAFSIGILDMFHTITYKGMQIIPDGNYFFANQFWIATRFIEAITLLFGFLYLQKKIERKFNPYLIILAYGLVAVLITLTILYWEIFPTCYIEGQGQTGFKIISEYVIITILIIALFFLHKNKKAFDRHVYKLLFVSIVFAILSEFSFSLYFSNYGVFNQIGHYAKLGTFIFIYKANVETGFTKPAETIFRSLKESEESHKQLSLKLQKKNEEYGLLNKELNLTVEKLDEANSTKDRFISILAHDLKNPFSALIGYSQLLVDNIDEYDCKKSKQIAQTLYNITGETYKLLNNLLEWSLCQLNKTSLKLQKTNLNSLVSTTYQHVMGSATHKNIAIHIDIPPKLEIEADTEMLKTVIRNLLSNAIKFTPENGSVNITATKNNESIQIVISDTGVGMSEETKNALFKIDETKSQPGTAGERGTGFGLLLCKEFIDKHQGTIVVESEIGKGSKFIIEIPSKNISRTELEHSSFSV